MVEGFNCCGGEDKVESYLECIVFEGHEAKLPRGWYSPNNTLTLEKMFTNWDEVEDPIDLIVDKEYIEELNTVYSGEGLFLGDPTSNKDLTLEEWTKKFGTDGVLLLGVKFHNKRKGVYTP